MTLVVDFGCERIFVDQVSEKCGVARTQANHEVIDHSRNKEKSKECWDSRQI